VVVWKRRVHQWRTDLLALYQGREYKIGQADAPLTRGEVKRMAIAHLERYAVPRVRA
jgi:hypothetical protein